jgi:hypothetical protein
MSFHSAASLQDDSPKGMRSGVAVDEAGVAGSPQVGRELRAGLDCSLWGRPTGL